jgi:hypothetical protein
MMSIGFIQKDEPKYECQKNWRLPVPVLDQARRRAYRKIETCPGSRWDEIDDPNFRPLRRHDRQQQNDYSQRRGMRQHAQEARRVSRNTCRQVRSGRRVENQRRTIMPCLGKHCDQNQEHAQERDSLTPSRLSIHCQHSFSLDAKNTLLRS